MSHLTDIGREGGLHVWMPRLFIIGIVAILGITTAWELLDEHDIIARSTAVANPAAISGPPCPALGAVQFQQALGVGPKLAYTFDFNGDSFGRAFGYADCDVAAAKGSGGLGSYDICQFTSPAILYVKTPRGAFYFQPGIGQKATVTTAGGQARCVMAAPKYDS
ncbi:MAG TPA: hypothetical protein VGG29_07130 [Caulobacteraceae bacterium]|jgi:hypothetical protein